MTVFMDELFDRIKKFNSDRERDLVPVKYEAMAENMFRFYRGTCHLFYEDLAGQENFPESPLVWICGDLHLENFGSFKSDNKEVYFDLNDFDEAILAPATWELVRFVTSIFVAFKTLNIGEKKAIRMAELFLKSYSATLQKGKAFYIERNTAQGIVYEFLSAVAKREQKHLLQKRIGKKKNKLRILPDDQRHRKIEKKLKQELCIHLNSWLKTDEGSPYNYKVINAVFRIAGTGSIGLKRYAVLLKSSNKVGQKYLLIDMKQAAPSSLFPYVDAPQPASENEAQRVISIQQRMQNRSTALLGISVFRNEHYIMQEMQPTEDRISFKEIKNRYRDMYRVIDDMSMLSASAQLRSSGQGGSAITDELKKFGNDQNWQAHVLDYAKSYSQITSEYYQIYLTNYKLKLL
jgi:uncharacterized protein (DUF2252 family)